VLVTLIHDQDLLEGARTRAASGRRVGVDWMATGVPPGLHLGDTAP
jgi:hypothetical protein